MSVTDPWGGFNEWGNWGLPGHKPRFFESGEVRLAILSLLNEAPKNGYQLMKDLAARSSGQYKASAGAVYPTLQQLEAERLIEGRVERGRRLLRLTKEGQRELKRDPETVRKIWDRAEQWGSWGQYSRADLAMVWRPLGELIKATMRAGTAAKDADAEDRIRAILRRAIKEMEELERR